MREQKRATYADLIDAEVGRHIHAGAMETMLVSTPAAESVERSRYHDSEELFGRAYKVIPGGIYGHKSPVYLVPGKYPHFLARGEGSRVWDVDGNEYIDLMCSYGPVVLGHCHPRVDEAARRQAAAGDCFNGPARVLVELAERLVGLTPWAGWAAFAKNGSDVVTYATLIARAATGRRKILTALGAFHGVHAWCTPIPEGTTDEDRAHVASYWYNDLDSVDAALAAHDGDVAAIVVSPFRHHAFQDHEMPAPGFMSGLRARADRVGAVVILDDVRAGFRLHLGGSGMVVGLEPDLTCYTKALANGHAISACLGRDALRDAAEKVYFSGTYWTNAVPMAAALACLDELERTDAISRMATLGTKLRDGVLRQAESHGVKVRYWGPPAIPFMTFPADEGSFQRSRLFAGACAERGVYLHPFHNWFLSAAITDADIAQVLDVTDEAFREVAGAEAEVH